MRKYRVTLTVHSSRHRANLMVTHEGLTTFFKYKTMTHVRQIVMNTCRFEP